MVAFKKMVHTFTNVDWLNAISFSGNPGIVGGFTMLNPVFITWLHLSMLIDIHTPLIISNQVTVDAHYVEIIDLDSLPICCSNNCDL